MSAQGKEPFAIMPAFGRQNIDTLHQAHCRGHALWKFVIALDWKDGAWDFNHSCLSFTATIAKIDFSHPYKTVYTIKVHPEPTDNQVAAGVFEVEIGPLGWGLIPTGLFAK